MQKPDSEGVVKKKLTPYQRIMRAAEKGREVHLSAEEVGRLSSDDAISKRALLDDYGDEEDSMLAIGIVFSEFLRTI